jgi:murein DD-endopeptidase MepM/ murein hydrolase activator NlpD
VTQVAGLGEIAIHESGGVVWPVIDPTQVTSPFGPREAPCEGCSTFHKGVDIAPGAGTPVMSIADGVVITATDAGGGLGTMAEVQHNVDGQVITSVYGHMLLGSLDVAVGDAVSAGEQLGLVGSTGQSTGPHLHLELFPEDQVRIDAYAWLTGHTTA